LRSALKEIKSNETVIDSKNDQIARYEEDILKLKARIKELIPHKKILSNQIEMANPTPPRTPRLGDDLHSSLGSLRISDTPRTFGSVSQSIRNKIHRNSNKRSLHISDESGTRSSASSLLSNFVEDALDELNQFYNQSQHELATEGITPELLSMML